MPVKIHWSAEQDSTIRELRAEGRPWDFIGEVIGVSGNSASERGRQLGAKIDRAPPRAVPPPDRTPAPLPAGHRIAWGIITAGTSLAGTPYPARENRL